MTRLGCWGQLRSVSLNIGASWRWGHWLRTFAASLLTNDSLRGWMGPRSCLDGLKKKKNLVVPVIRLRLPDCPGRGLVTTPAEVPRLLFDDLGKYLCGLFCILKKTTKSWNIRSPSHVLNSGHPNTSQLC